MAIKALYKKLRILMIINRMTLCIYDFFHLDKVLQIQHIRNCRVSLLLI